MDGIHPHAGRIHTDDDGVDPHNAGEGLGWALDGWLLRSNIHVHLPWSIAPSRPETHGRTGLALSVPVRARGYRRVSRRAQNARVTTCSGSTRKTIRLAGSGYGRPVYSVEIRSMIAQAASPSIRSFTRPRIMAIVNGSPRSVIEM